MKVCSGVIDFKTFNNHLENNDVEAAKRMVTIENANIRTPAGYNVLSFVCAHGPDDPELLHHCLSLGAVMCKDTCVDCVSVRDCWSPLHFASNKGKQKLVRAIIDFGVNVNICDHHGAGPIQYAHPRCILQLLDAGAKLKEKHTPQFAQTFLDSRIRARSAAIAILVLPRYSIIGSKDVFRIIARCVWETRKHECWEK